MRLLFSVLQVFLPVDLEPYLRSVKHFMAYVYAIIFSDPTC